MTEPENQAEALAKLRKEYRPTMDAEVLHSWAADVVAALAALPEAPAVLVVKALRNIAEGNLGDAPWQANYDKIREVARAALQSAPPVKAVDGEIDRLRKALIAAGRHVGAGLADDVSTDFLMLVPEEVRLVMEQHRAALASQNAVEGEAVATVDQVETAAKVIWEAFAQRYGGAWSGRYSCDAADMCWRSAEEIFRRIGPRPAAADAGVREALTGFELRSVIYDALDLSEELRVECTDAVVAALSLAAKREQAR